MKPEKKAKDLAQARVLLRILKEELPEELEEAFREIREYGKRTRRKLQRILTESEWSI